MISTISKSLLILATSIAFIGCGGGSSNNPATSVTTKKLGSLGYVELPNSSLKTNVDGSVEGSGLIAFTQPLSELRSKQHIKVSFELQDGGSLTLNSNANTKLEEAVAIKFTREGEALRVLFIAEGNQTEISEKFSGIDARTILNFEIDVHNNETPAHILIWAPGSDYSEESALVNSEDGYEVPGNGKGTFWGFTLEQGKVLSVGLEAAKFSEE
jgi:hypothetical protein